MKKVLFPLLLMIIILFFHNDVIAGTISGLLLWYQTLIPALLPFILITNSLSEMQAYQIIVRKAGKYIHHIPELTAVLLGNVCGYPIGAKILNDLVAANCISKKRAGSLLAISSQASPMFLIGYVYNNILNRNLPIYIFLLSIYIPVIIGYIIKIFLYKRDDNYINYVIINDHTDTLNLNDSFIESVKTIVLIGIYVIIFSIILKILLNNISNTLIKCFISFLEISTGLNLLKQLSLKPDIFTILVTTLSSFGGFCTMYQIKSVLYNSVISTKKYLSDKIIMSTGTLIIISIYLNILR